MKGCVAADCCCGLHSHSAMQQPFPTAVQRTCKLYALALARQFVYEHRNGVVVVGLAPGHPALTPPPGTTVSVAFASGITVQRKRKRGKQSGSVRARQPLCNITCGGEVYPVVAAVHGYVLELNTALEADPSLLLSHVSNGTCAEIGQSHNCVSSHSPIPVDSWPSWRPVELCA